MKRMIRANLDPELLDWTYGTEWEGKKSQLARQIVTKRQQALDANSIEDWKEYRSWARSIQEMFSNVFDNVRELEEWALVKIQYKNVR